MMTVSDVAEYLRLKNITVYKYASKKYLPGFKIGSQWRFRKSEIDKWIKKGEIKCKS